MTVFLCQLPPCLSPTHLPLPLTSPCHSPLPLTPATHLPLPLTSPCHSPPPATHLPLPLTSPATHPATHLPLPLTSPCDLSGALSPDTWRIMPGGPHTCTHGVSEVQPHGVSERQGSQGPQRPCCEPSHPGGTRALTSTRESGDGGGSALRSTSAVMNPSPPFHAAPASARSTIKYTCSAWRGVADVEECGDNVGGVWSAMWCAWVEAQHSMGGGAAQHGWRRSTALRDGDEG
ncbi:unnamed protein product [Closterium sp. Naga37s-1]|nr:unnamed protein product [Closterium sp. Naga37s-1]